MRGWLTDGIEAKMQPLIDKGLIKTLGFIPDAQMRSFILVAGTYDEAVIYVEPEELKLVKGTKVRITGGVFEGAVGEFVRLRHDRRVVVNIEGVMAVATTFIHSSLIEPIGVI